MIDTVQLRQCIPLPPSAELVARGWSTLCGHDARDVERARWTFNPQTGADGVLPRLTWRMTPSGAWLNAEVSVPKSLHGNNVAPLRDGDIGRALEKISRYVSAVAHADFDAHSSLVGRVDYCWNFPVGEENICHYISSAATVSLSRMTTNKIADTTVTWKQRSKTISLYDKRAEVARLVSENKATAADERAAKGLLRLEVSYKRSDSVKRLAERHGLPNRDAQSLLVSGIAYAELDRALKMLGLNQVSCTVDERVDRLRAMYGDTRRCHNLLAFIALQDRYGKDFHGVGIGGYSPTTYYRHVRDLKEAGVLRKVERQLPPLHIFSPPRSRRTAGARRGARRSMSNTT